MAACTAWRKGIGCKWARGINPETLGRISDTALCLRASDAGKFNVGPNGSRARREGNAWPL